MPSRIDLQGQIFGEWEVVEYIGKSIWRCKNIITNDVKDIHSYTLRNKYKQVETTKKPVVNLENQVFGLWKAEKFIGGIDNVWLCKCECGRTGRVKEFDLLNKNSTRCNNPIHKLKEDYTNQIINGWQVLEYVGRSLWNCKSDKGTIKYIRSRDLKNKTVKADGYKPDRHKIRKDIAGKTFGYLEVIEYTGQNQMWRCKCHGCGKITDIFSNSITSGKTKSCGCMKEKLRADTLLKRYGDINTTKIANPREDWQIEATSSKESLQELIDKYFKETPTVTELSEALGINDTSVIKRLKAFNMADNIVNKSYQISDMEKSLRVFIETLIDKEKIKYNDRKTLDGKELDIYIPEKALAIEFNGDYWHSSMMKEKTFHQDKSLACIKRGIHLIHIFEYEWMNLSVREKLKEHIKSSLNIGKEINADDAIIKQLSNLEAIEFLNKYHLQGATSLDISYGCIYNDELIGVLAFRKLTNNQNYDWELVRICCKPGYKVTDGNKEIFNYFCKENNPDSILSYCDITKFSIDVYNSLGFVTKESCLTDPNYVWVNNRKEVLSNTEKEGLIKAGLHKFGSTEDEILDNLGYFKIYDSGNIKFEWFNTKK